MAIQAITLRRKPEGGKSGHSLVLFAVGDYKIGKGSS